MLLHRESWRTKHLFNHHQQWHRGWLSVWSERVCWAAFECHQFTQRRAPERTGHLVNLGVILLTFSTLLICTSVLWSTISAILTILIHPSVILLTSASTFVSPILYVFVPLPSSSYRLFGLVLQTFEFKLINLCSARLKQLTQFPIQAFSQFLLSVCTSFFPMSYVFLYFF